MTKVVIEPVQSGCTGKDIGYLARGEHALADVVAAIKKGGYSGDVSEAKEVHILPRAGLECWHGCGFYHPRATRGDGHLKHCEGGDENWVWNFNSGPYLYTLVMVNGHDIGDLS